jgi:hypothetical protein
MDSSQINENNKLRKFFEKHNCCLGDQKKLIERFRVFRIIVLGSGGKVKVFLAIENASNK